jgi:uncharacterized protein (TIGR02266 family)
VAGLGVRGRVSRLRPKRVDINRDFESIADFTEYVSNISTTGCFIRTRNPWPVGTKLKLKFTVTLDDLEPLEGMGEVVRVSERPRGMGVNFIDLPAHAIRVIHAIIGRAKRRSLKRGR